MTASSTKSRGVEPEKECTDNGKRNAVINATFASRCNDDAGEKLGKNIGAVLRRYHEEDLLGITFE